jgi:hypothetical protein
MTKFKTKQHACRICRRGKALRGARCNGCQARLDQAIAKALEAVR